MNPIRYFLLLAALCFLLPFASAHAPDTLRSSTSSSTKTGDCKLIITVDSDCFLWIDASQKGAVKKGEVKEVLLKPGEHLVMAKDSKGLVLKKEKMVLEKGKSKVLDLAVDIGSSPKPPGVTASDTKQMGNPCPGLEQLEYEGQTYHTVQIGSQCWMKENLNVGRMINSSVKQTNNQIYEKYCYNNLDYNCNIYGGLYTWDEIMDYNQVEGNTGICPFGWHLPSRNDWIALFQIFDTVSTETSWLFDAGNELKEIGQKHWFHNTQSANNTSGLSLLGGGVFACKGEFDYILGHGAFWSSTVDDQNFVYCIEVVDYESSVRAQYSNVRSCVSASVRCILND